MSILKTLADTPVDNEIKIRCKINVKTDKDSKGTTGGWEKEELVLLLGLRKGAYGTTRVIPRQLQFQAIGPDWLLEAALW